MPFQNVSISRTTTNGANVIIGYEQSYTGGEIGLSIAVDYTQYYMRIADSIETISNTLITIKSHVANIDSHIENIDASIENLNTRGSNQNLGIITRQYEDEEWDLNSRQRRAVLVSAIKNSGGLDDLKSEITNPTPLPKS